MVKFFKNHFKKRLDDVMVFTHEQGQEESKKLIERIKCNEKIAKSGLKVLVSDIKDSSSVFGFIPDSKFTGRILRYGHLYNEKTNKIIPMSDIYIDPKLKEQCEYDYKHLYTLKHRIDQD